MLSVIYGECHKQPNYAECCSAECCYAECHSAALKGAATSNIMTLSRVTIRIIMMLSRTTAE